MLYLLLICLPAALAAGCSLAPERRWTGLIATGLAVVGGLGLVLWRPVAAPMSWLGSTLQLSPFKGVLLGSWLLMLIGLVPLSLVRQDERSPAAIVLLMSGALSAALVSSQLPLTILLLVSVMVLSSLLLVDSASVALQYVAVAVIGAVFFIGAAGLVGDGLAGTSTGIALAGLAMWVLLVPALLIFSGVVEQISLPTLGILAGALPQLAGLLAGYGIAPDAHAAMAMALLALVPAGTLLLVPARPRRLLVLLLIADSCLMLPGLLSGSDTGLRAALLGSVVHAFAVVLLLAGLAAIEYWTGRSSRHTYVSVLVVLFGLLILIGIPPLPGWYARLASWNTARDAGRLMALLFGAGQLLLIAGAGRLAFVLLREARLETVYDIPQVPARQRGEQLVYVVLLLLLAAAVLSGFAVRPLLNRVDAARYSRVIP